MKKVLFLLASLGLTAASASPIVHFLTRNDDAEEVNRIEEFSYSQNLSGLVTEEVDSRTTIVNISVDPFNEMLYRIWERYPQFNPIYTVQNVNSTLSNFGFSQNGEADKTSLSMILNNPEGETTSMTAQRLVFDKNPYLNSEEINFHVEGDFKRTSGEIFEKVRLANFPRFIGLSSTSIDQILNSVFNNKFTINFNFWVSINWVDTQHEFKNFVIPVSDISGYTPFQILELLNGGNEFGDEFREEIIAYIYEKTFVQVFSITFFSIWKSEWDANERVFLKPDDGFLTSLDEKNMGGWISEEENRFFYVGIESVDSGGTFFILLEYRTLASE